MAHNFTPRNAGQALPTGKSMECTSLDGRFTYIVDGKDGFVIIRQPDGSDVFIQPVDAARLYLLMDSMKGDIAYFAADYCKRHNVHGEEVIPGYDKPEEAPALHEDSYV